MKRIEWVDSLRGFGIFCVTIGHLACNFLIETHIYSFHMFLFFFISGFLHSDKQGNFKEYMSKKTKTIFMPFLFWNILSVLAGIVLFGVDIGTSIGLLFLLDGQICWNAPIWFLLLLYMTQVVYFFIKKYIPYGNYVSIPILLVLWGFVSSTNVIMKLNLLPICLLFYVLGNVYKEFYKKYEDEKKGKKIVVPVCIAFLSINLVFGVYLNGRITFTGAYFGNVLYCVVGAIAGVMFYTLLFQNVQVLQSSKVLSYLGKNSLIIMAMQYWLFKFYDFVFSKFSQISVWHYRSTLKALVVSVVTMALICGFSELVKALCKKNAFAEKLCGLTGIR